VGMFRAAGLAGLVVIALSGCAANDDPVLAVRGTSVATTNACEVGQSPSDDSNDPGPSSPWNTSTQPSTVLAKLPLASAEICPSMAWKSGGKSEPVPTGALPELAEALGQPDSDTALGGCTLMNEWHPIIVVVDADGYAINTYLPKNDCGRILPETRQALDRVRVLVGSRS